MEFYRREYPGAVRLAGLLAGTNSAAEDIAQDALMILRERFDQVDNPSAYLRGVVVNCCRHWHRDRATFAGAWSSCVLVLAPRMSWGQMNWLTWWRSCRFANGWSLWAGTGVAGAKRRSLRP